MMKKLAYGFALLALFAPHLAFAATQKSQYGRLYVETTTSQDAWYVNAVDGKTTYFANPAQALKSLPQFALGITNADLFKIARAEDTTGSFDMTLSKRLAGRFLLQIQDKGQVWYVHPTSYKRYFIGSENDVLAVYKASAIIASSTALNTLTYAPSYTDAVALLKQSHTLMAGEKAPFKNLGEQKIADGKITRRANAKTVVYSFTLPAGIPSDNLGYPYGPLAAGTYHLTSNTKFFNNNDFLNSDEYYALQGTTKSEVVLRAVLQVQTALEFYRSDIGGYPVSSELVSLPTEKEIVFSREHGFFGTNADAVVYARFRLPKITNNEYFYISFDGLDYSMSYTLESDTGGFRAGRYILSSQGVQSAAE